MSTIMNKIANKITNQTGSLLGRENLNKLTNSLNKVFWKSKFRDYLKAGNIIQLISKTTKMSIQICASNEDPQKLFLIGNGQIGPEFTSAHFKIEIDPKKGHFKFNNAINYIAFDIDFPCVLHEPTQKPKNKHELMRGRNEFRVHEIIGSEEYFALESAYSPGRYLAVLPDGSVSYTRDKSDQRTHFCLTVIYVLPQNIPANARLQPMAQSSASAIDADSRRESSVINVTDEKPVEKVEDVEEEEKWPSGAEAPPSYNLLYPQLPKNL